MPMDLTVPSELVDLCQNGGSVEVAGRPGTGKTLFCLTVLDALAERGCKVGYMSTRVPIQSVLSTYPKCQKTPGMLLVDATRSSGGPVDSGNVVHVQLNDTADLAVFMMDNMEKGSILAIDSWEGLTERDPRLRIQVESAMMDVMNQIDVGLLIAREKSWQGPLSHSVDGQVSLGYLELDGIWVRRLQIGKVRGRGMERRGYLFSLNGGKFSTVDTVGLSPRGLEVKLRSFPKPMPERDDRFSTGIGDMDAIFGGGFIRGSYVTLETAPDAPPHLLSMLTLPLMADFIVKGRGVVFLPTAARDAATELAMVRSLFGSESWDDVRRDRLVRYLKVVEMGPGEPSDPEISLVAEGMDPDRDFKILLELKRDMTRKGNGPALCVVGYDTVEAVYGEEGVARVVGRVAPTVRKEKGLHVSLTNPDLAGTRRLMTVSDYYMRARLVDGTALLWGVKPRTSAFAILIEDPGGWGRVRLVPMT